MYLPEPLTRMQQADYRCDRLRSLEGKTQFDRKRGAAGQGR